MLSGAVRAREPRFARFSAVDRISLPAHSATMDDCCRLMELLLGAQPAGPQPLTLGVLEIVSLTELSVSAVYTVTDLAGVSTSIDVEQVSPRLSTLGSSAALGREPAPSREMERPSGGGASPPPHHH